MTEGLIYDVTINRGTFREKKYLKLIRKYKYFALFEDMLGIRECFSYFELKGMRGDKE